MFAPTSTNVFPRYSKPASRSSASARSKVAVLLPVEAREAADAELLP
jgi:hypothetical protein